MTAAAVPPAPPAPHAAPASTVTSKDVLEIRDRLVARGFTPAEVLAGTRAETYGLLQLESPLPLADVVTDADRIAADHARAKDPNFTSAHHWVQKRHATKLWERTFALVAEAGVK